MTVQHLRRAASVIALAVAAVVLSGCLGPNDPDPSGQNPFGSLDSITVDGDGVRMRGWVIDPNTAAPITVSAWRDGKEVRARADRSRPDVGRAHPRHGSRHGFDFRYPSLRPGLHTICVSADNVGPGSKTRVLGCKDLRITHDPFGRWDRAVGTRSGHIEIDGWARDLDSSAPVQVGVVLDGTRVAVVDANLGRGTVSSARGQGANRGFSLRFPASVGAHDVCLVMGNRGPGAPSWLGCRRIVVPPPPVDHRPTGSITGVTPVGPGSLLVEGTASDRDTSGPVKVSVAVSGRVQETQTGPGRTFSLQVDGLAAGPHEVCVTLIDALGPGRAAGNRTLPCGSAVLGDTSVGTGGTPGPGTPVQPGPNHPLRGMDRDGGVSVVLGDGSLLWLFGDTLERNAQGVDKYFVNNTAAWASAADPVVTTDPVAPDGGPEEFVTPVENFTCPGEGTPSEWAKGMWPMSATVVPHTGDSERVVAFFANICLGGPGEFVDRGTAIVEWIYHGARPAGGLIRGTVVEQKLSGADDLLYGTASIVEDVDGVPTIHAYACGSPAPSDDIQFPDQWGTCTVARAPASTIHDRTTWTWWDGAGWSAEEGDAVTMEGIPDPTPGIDSKAPVSAFTIVFDPGANAYVMVYSPWPGYTGEIFIRVATTPVGPWSEPVTVRVPGCNDRIGSTGYFCYAATAQPALSKEGLLGLGYYDQLVRTGPNSGAYITVTVPFAVVITGD